MSNRKQVFTGSPWEPVVGYCRAIRIGNRVEVAGTTAMKGDQVIGEGDAYLQSKQALATIEDALREVGATLSDVVRTRMFVTDISQWEAIGRAHGEAFRDICPVAEVKALIDPRLLVEIEAEAVICEEQ